MYLMLLTPGRPMTGCVPQQELSATLNRLVQDVQPIHWARWLSMAGASSVSHVRMDRQPAVKSKQGAWTQFQPPAGIQLVRFLASLQAGVE